MIYSDRLRDVMGERQISQAELARRVGVSQQTIAKLFQGVSSGSRYLHRIARELGTTPAYLEGEVDDPNEDAPTPPAADSESREMMEHFGHLAPADRRALLQIARSMAGGGTPSDTVHAPSRGYRGEESDPDLGGDQG